MDRIEKYLEKLVQNPRDDNINFELAYAYEKEGQYAAAVSYYLRCAEFTNNNIMASECLIRCSFSMNKQGGRDQKELHYIKQSIGASPCSLEPYYIASLYFSWRGNYRDSYLYACLGINIYENNIQNEKFLKEINFSLPDLYCQKAMQGLKIGKINEARQIYVNILRNFDISDNLRTYILQTIENLLTQHNPILYNKDEKNKLKYQFPNCKEITENFSQIYQDMFVLSMNNGKKNGTYFEVGSAHYSINNNTFLLETQFDWQGISIDINQQSIMSFNNNRKNVGICADATSIDYIQLFSEHYKSTNIDYLQLDCDPPNITFDVLEKIPFDTYKFGVITYEHDFYNDITGSYREKSRVFLKSKGYKLICGNISPLKDKYPFEDWWIHPDIINKKIYKLFERANDDPINGEKYMLTKSKIAEDPIGLSLLIEEQSDKENDILIKSKYFKASYQIITFGTDDLYKNQKIRFKKQATDIDFFDNIIIEDEKTIKPLLKEHENFIINNKKGYGYWIWKPIIIKNQLEKMSENDILFYLDCGSSIINNNDKLNEYINILKDKEIIVFNNTDYKIKSYIKTNVINEFNITDDILETYQIEGGCIILKNSKKTKEFIDEWIKYMIKDNYQLLNDDLLTLSQNKEFIQNRHDQSILTVLARQKDYIYINNGLEELYSNGPFLHTRLTDMGARQWSGMRLINNLNNFPKVLILSIYENKSRQQALINACKRYNLNYELFECLKYPDCKSNYICNYKFPENNHNIGVTCGYIKMLKYWYDNYTEDYAFFCEDDIDFTISDKWGFTWDDFMNELDSKWSIVQTVIIKEEPANLDFNLSKKKSEEWCITGNLIKRDYCKYLLDQYYIDDTNYNLSMPDYEQIAIPLVPEDLIYRDGFLYNSKFYYPLSKPLFTENNKFQTNELHIRSNSYIANYYNIRSKSISQLYQDVNVITFFNKKEKLFFVDIGANDGINMSNTCLLEKEYKWFGICSEPLPEAFEKLIKCRSVDCDNNAVFNKTGLTLDFSHSDLFSGLTEYIDKHTHVKNCAKSKVNTITLQDLLEKYKTSNIIHYLSLDTQGSELEILRSVNYSQYTFLYITLEHNYIEPKRSLMRDILLSNGYLYKGENEWEDEYIHESNILGTFYYDKKYETPITIKKIDNNVFSASSNYWKDDIAKFDKGSLYFETFGKANIFNTHIDFGQFIDTRNCRKYGWGNIWHRDERKNILFIGSNSMDEICNYTSTYKNGIFIEAIPNIYEQLKGNLNYANNTYNTNYIAVNQLLTDKIGEEYQFNIFSNNGASSSIFEPNIDKWRELHPEWNGVDKTHEITLISSTIENIIKKYGWENKTYDVVLDVQGAELVVLKGFGKDNIKNIDKLHVEISQEKFYDGGVLFPELNDFIISNGFKIISNPIYDHCDVTYVKNDNHDINYFKNSSSGPWTCITSIN